MIIINISEDEWRLEVSGYNFRAHICKSEMKMAGYGCYI